MLIVVAGVAVPVIFGIKAIIDTASDTIDDLKPGGADVFTEQGLDALTDDIEDATGSTEVFSVVLYPEYAVVTTPADRSSKRYINYYWDGNLSESSKGSGIYDGRFDMRDIKAKVVKDLLDKARQLVEGPTSNYVVISPPGIGRRQHQRLRQQRLQRERLPHGRLRRQGHRGAPAELSA